MNGNVHSIVSLSALFFQRVPAAECTPDLMELIKIIARIYGDASDDDTTLNILENLRAHPRLIGLITLRNLNRMHANTTHSIHRAYVPTISVA